jgi:hypothetical protein
MDAPAPEAKGTTHAYIARAWYRDPETWYLIGAFLYFVVQDQANVDLLFPASWHATISKLALLVALFLRWKSSTRPVALREGTIREVYSIPPRPTK